MGSDPRTPAAPPADGGTGDWVARLGALSTSGVSDALDRLGIAGQCQGIGPRSRDFRLVGQAFTVRYGPVGVHGGTVGDYIDDVAPGAVVVLDNAGRVDATVWGDILTVTAHRNGVAGTVIDGVCRDLARSLELRYPLFSRGVWMRTGKDRVRVEQVQGTVCLGGVPVTPGDVVLGDGDGVVVVPASRVPEVVVAAETIEAVEDRIRAAVAAGRPLREARAEAGYHTLQSRSAPSAG